jgi:N-acetylmuramoyl-L-alanine amidase
MHRVGTGHRRGRLVTAAVTTIAAGAAVSLGCTGTGLAAAGPGRTASHTTAHGPETAASHTTADQPGTAASHTTADQPETAASHTTADQPETAASHTTAHGPGTAASHTTPTGPGGGRMALMRAAARASGVPVRLLLAISYDQTRWQSPGAGPSADGSYGLMGLTAAAFRGPDGRGLPGRPAVHTITVARSHDTLTEAARLLRLPARTLQASDWQNVRGAAAVLARYARALGGGTLPGTLGGWYGAVAAYSGATSRPAARAYADSVFAILGTGAALTTSDGQSLRLPPSAGLRPQRGQLAALHLGAAAAPTSPPVSPPAPPPASPGAAAFGRTDCPASLHCQFLPAAYARDSTDPANYGNYDLARRPARMRTPAGGLARMAIRYLVIHDTESSYQSAISTFRNPASYVSANYVIRSADGAVTEMVRPRDVAWGAGDWYVNMHGISIENEGFAAQGRDWYTEAMYRADAALVRYLAGRYGIPLDRQHILGHEDVPGPTTALTAAQHWDPGPFWNWNHFMALVHQVSDQAEQASGGSTVRGSHRLVTIDPTFARNKPVVTDCAGGRCVTLPSQPASFVYLRTGPGGSHPLLGDRVLGSRHGTTEDSDWGDKATAGETFVLAGQRGNWTAIWFSGRRAWFWNPPGAARTARYTSGQVITPRAGRSWIPVYGAAYPGASAYPPAVPVMTLTRLAYTIRAGQQYPEAGLVPTDFYYAATINSSLPDDHTLIIGPRSFCQISFNHRKFFVRASDVTVRTLP